MEKIIKSYELNKAVTFSRLFSRINLSPSSRLVLRCLIDFWNAEKGYSFPKQQTIADCTGLTRTSVVNAIEELRMNELIETRQGKYTLYYSFCTKFLHMVFGDRKVLLPDMLKDLTSRCVRYSHITNNITDLINKEQENKNFSEDKCVSPYDNYECAVNWLNSLEENTLKHRVIREQVDKVRKIWNIPEEGQ